MINHMIVRVVAAAVLVSGSLIAQEAGKGQEIFSSSCVACHHVDDGEKVGAAAPLKGLYKRKALFNGKSVTDENVLEVISTGAEGMPAFKEILTDSERADVIAYLKTI